jgi:MFS family permease
MIGTLIATAGPIPMLFGMGVANFVVFITLIAFAEALYSPIINVFTFNFTRVGREGTFLTLTAAPTYFTMALTGIVGGYLLENYYPVLEDETHKKEPEKIWLVIMFISALSTISLYLGRNYFNMKEAEAGEVPELFISDQDNLQTISTLKDKAAR